MATKSGKSVPRSTFRGELVGQILRRIFSGELRGGDRLVEEELAATYGVSRTPIREVLGELTAIGLIRMKPNHGAMVRPFGPAQLVEIYHVRRILEVEATRQAANRLQPNELIAFRSLTQNLIDAPLHDETWAEDALALDQQFHELLSRNSGSERLAEEIGKYRTLVVAVGNAVGNKLHAHEQNLGEHMAIIDHLLAHESNEAAETMGHHIDRGAATAAKWLELVFANGSVRRTPSV